MTGRHRDGLPYTPVYRRVWDGPARAEAERIDQAWADWTVLYSLGRRAFYAVAAWEGPRPVIVADPTAEGLEERMREAEMIRAMRLAAPASRPSPAPTSKSSPAPVRRERGGAGRPSSEARNEVVAEEPGGERGSPTGETASAGGRRSSGEGMVSAGGRLSPGEETVSARDRRSPGGRAA
ncbi:hypothetical protein ACFYY8_13470 [Streptosporangium sp. NPDC001559]|uniref:hypothetical protein n=1 Tax=Streptosporangium sp. NPDC001559 TaxID=3366187 RepID=UPI0036E64A1D